MLLYVKCKYTTLWARSNIYVILCTLYNIDKIQIKSYKCIITQSTKVQAVTVNSLHLQSSQ